MADFVAYNEMMKRCCVSGAEDQSSAAGGFTPSLPDEIFLNCLVRVPLQSHANLHHVSKSIRSLMESDEYYSQRHAENASSSYFCLLQRDATDATSGFGITLVDVECATWERLPSIPGLPSGLPTFAKLVCVGRELIVMGGWWENSWEPSVSVFVYNFGTQRWRQGADMPAPRSFFACAALGTRIMVAGGHDVEKQALNSVACYDVATNSWSSRTSLTLPRDEPTGVTLAGKFYVVSGYGSDSQGLFTTSAEVYDETADSWRLVENMWTATDAGDAPANPTSLAALAGSVYGVHGDEVVQYSGNPGAEQHSWRVVAKMPEECDKRLMTSVSVAATDSALLITGLVKKNESSSLRTMKLTPPCGKRKAEWMSLDCEEEFSSLAQTSCAFQL